MRRADTSLRAPSNQNAARNVPTTEQKLIRESVGVKYCQRQMADNPNLPAFKVSGGKLIMWQGLADQLILTGDSINHYNQVVVTTSPLASVTAVLPDQEALPRLTRCSRSSTGARTASRPPC
jgi:Tannase and feruloyl esterase